MDGTILANRRNLKRGLIMFETKLRTFALAATLLTSPARAHEGFTSRDFSRTLKNSVLAKQNVGSSKVTLA
jgi:hypothetical protein